MRRILAIGTVLMLTAAGAGQAGVSATVTATSDYDFRGITQSAKSPALQASIDYAHDSGFYAGAWASNIDFGPGDPNLELDLYAGFAKSIEGGIGWDVGLVYYTYPSVSDDNFFEAYGSISYEWFKGKLWYSPDFGGKATPGNTPAWYVDGLATIALPQGYALPIHVGYSGGDYWDTIEYFDWSVGVTKSLGHFNFALKFIDGSDLKVLNNTPGDIFSSDNKIVFSVATTFPWSNE
ncbi:MAG: TorF family putative porin [Steroidobacterales bacterium]